MENLALTTLLLPFIGALVVSFSPQRRAAEWGVLFAALTTLCMLSLISAFYQADKVAVTLTLVNVGDVALFGLVIDRVSTLILFVVVFLGLLVTIYSTGYLTDKNREHPHNGTNRYYAFLLVFIGAMAGLVLSSTLLGQLLFFEITGGCSWALISYYQSDKAQRSALKALLITHIGSLGLYLAAATLFLQTGTFALSAMSELHGDARYLVYGGILFAAWGKSAQLPMATGLKPALAVALGHFLLGLLCIVSQRNILRQIFGYCLMENGSHLVLALLAWRAPELVEIGIATDAIFAVIVMVLLARKIWRTHGTLDVNNLTALKG
ncbi:hydrogenase 4 membrane subunit [Escherichia coli]|uniref:hydrogenase 4 membrane subunit n=1 Tax=Escherichia coli TaxID=562 RepID=UPI00124AA264|nr:hydrogenase 4 membrane subunit [Escherichia coli]EFH3954965.1 hydrogenase 4 membrane subunit [Escherichia coli]KAA8772104.1 hydrogenase 4 membrane subunit [Escherichia coli]MCA7823428.1 hydrogenase 4 membrane subunit [Escherichia coli]MCI3700578.1 hydrogenase 4 membrane subunit [Escherichia coli]MEC4219461.1 hydrogenase 4 membrane subunit [Escherichia coli]